MLFVRSDVTRRKSIRRHMCLALIIVSLVATALLSTGPLLSKNYNLFTLLDRYAEIITSLVLVVGNVSEIFWIMNGDVHGIPSNIRHVITWYREDAGNTACRKMPIDLPFEKPTKIWLLLQCGSQTFTLAQLFISLLLLINSCRFYCKALTELTLSQACWGLVCVKLK